jgi:hypothetical protein
MKGGSTPTVRAKTDISRLAAILKAIEDGETIESEATVMEVIEIARALQSGLAEAKTLAAQTASMRLQLKDVMRVNADLAKERDAALADKEKTLSRAEEAIRVGREARAERDAALARYADAAKMGNAWKDERDAALAAHAELQKSVAIQYAGEGEAFAEMAKELEQARASAEALRADNHTLREIVGQLDIDALEAYDKAKARLAPAPAPKADPLCGCGKYEPHLWRLHNLAAPEGKQIDPGDPNFPRPAPETAKTMGAI